MTRLTAYTAVCRPIAEVNYQRRAQADTKRQLRLLDDLLQQVPGVQLHAAHVPFAVCIHQSGARKASKRS